MKFYLIIVAVAFVLFLYNSVVYKKNAAKKLENKIRNGFGKPPEREYDFEEFVKIKRYFEKHKGERFYIDDITWNDLDMDSIFMLLNNTYSSAGEEYLYKTLRVPEFDVAVLEEKNKLINYFLENEEKLFELQKIFASLGRTKKISLCEFIDRFTELTRRSNVIHYILNVLFFSSIVLLFLKPVIGIIMFLSMFVINVGTYYKEKAKIESYFTCLKYLMDMINCGNILKKVKCGEVKKYTDLIEEDLGKLRNISKGIFWISINGSSGSAGEVVMEYVRMITHADIIKFYNVLDSVKRNLDVVEELYETYGMLEACMAIASFRKMIEQHCIPEFSGKNQICAKEVFHPLISEPVANSINEEKSVLLTGSNASGKSTFLKTIAINAILAQTIYTCTAQRFVTNFYKIYSSMSLRDDLSNSESYYIVEIKAIKRIIDAVNDEIPVLCFVDEVLRGTNTVERIAASTQILKVMANKNAICYAATHDIELTSLLENDFSNYHFKEEVENDDIIFNYKLLKGKATSRNAIKLLKIMGFNEEIVDEAQSMAEVFVEQGVWR